MRFVYGRTTLYYFSPQGHPTIPTIIAWSALSVSFRAVEIYYV